MQFIVVSRITIAVVCLSFLGAGLIGQSQRGKAGPAMMDDPLFGMSYDLAKVHFDDAPTAVTDLCSELRGRKLWLYAVHKTSEADYYIVSGLIEVHRDDPAQSVEGSMSDGGEDVELKGGKCYLSTYGALFSEKVDPDPRVPKASRPVLEALVSDALTRYSKAFGGKQNLIRELSNNHVSPADLPPVLRSQVEVFVKSQ